MKPLVLILLFAIFTSACQKKDNVQTTTSPVSHPIDTPVHKVDSNNYYPSIHDTAFYSGINCDSEYSIKYLTDTVYVIRNSKDSIRIIDKNTWIQTLDLYKIDSSNHYESSSKLNGYTNYVFSGMDSLGFKAFYDNPCSNAPDEYNYTFKGKRYK